MPFFGYGVLTSSFLLILALVAVYVLRWYVVIVVRLRALRRWRGVEEFGVVDSASNEKGASKSEANKAIRKI